MGGGPSQPPPEPLPQPPAFLDTPWRTINWGDNERVLQFVKNYKPKTEGQQLRVLLHGPAGSGKSSFINSVQSVIYGRMYTQALVNTISHTSFIKRYSTYKVQKEGSGSFCPLVFNDIMGLDPIDGFLVDDIKLALKGHVKDGYRFDPETQLLEDDPFYNRSPTSNDKVHVLVCVIPADTISQINEKTLLKIRDIRIAASELGIPQVVVLTKIDEISPEISGNLRNAYRVKSLKKKMERFSDDVGFPMNCIFPVKNYNTEIDLNDDVDSLILSVLKHIINFGDDYIDFRKIMGGGPSQPFPQPPALLDTPWRTVNWGDNERVLQLVKNYKPKTEVMGGGPSQPPAFLDTPWRIIKRGDNERVLQLVKIYKPKTEVMGAGTSKPAALLDTPWRTVNWGDNERVLQFVKNYKPKTEGQQLRVLLHGPDGSGKSSFINSVQSVIYGRMYTQALVDNISSTSFIKRYSTYKVQKEGSGSFCPLVFNDIMGLDPIDGFLVDDIKLALKGHVKDGYRFNPETQLLEDDPFYNRSPTSNDKVHILVCVIPADTIGQLTEETLLKIWDIRIAASELGIPQVVVLTKIDEVSPEISGNLRNTYRLKSLKKTMEEFSVDVGFPMNCIFPVKNYNTEIDLNDDVDSLILSVLKHIINFGDDYINFRQSPDRLINF